MLNFWARLIKDNKLQQQYTVEVAANQDAALQLKDGLAKVCYHLDLAQPMVQEKHLRDMQQYGFTRFLPESFMEDVPFDKMDVSIFDQHAKNKKK